jgi:Dynamin family
MLPSDADSLLIEHLKTAIVWLDPSQHAQLRQDAFKLCELADARSTRPEFRIVIFGPFNYGKSTLLNALLGDRTLPMDLIPTTGAAISVHYGTTLQTRIGFKDGSTISDAGTDILKQFAILDEQRRMRDDVVAVTVECPHPFLQTGVELLDLPGTDDREDQDLLVRDQLLTADLVVQVLDGRKLMTLGEREHLRDWLIDRGITTIVFVVNFLNLLTPDEQQQVYNRLRFVAESFRAKLPHNVSNLYRVDALPALRARLKGDAAAAQMAGLPIFESALQQIVAVQREQPSQIWQPRLIKLAEQVQHALSHDRQVILATLTTQQEKQTQKAQIQQKAQGLIRQGFEASVAALRDWLTLSNLLGQYQTGAVMAVQRFEFKDWENHALKSDWNDHRKGVTEWVYKACDFFQQPRPADLWVTFPDEPSVKFSSDSLSSSSTSMDSTLDRDVPTAIATGFGWVIGGPVGAAVLGGASYLFNRIEVPVGSSSSPSVDLEQLYKESVNTYLSQFRMRAIEALDQYYATVIPFISTIPVSRSEQMTPQHYQLQQVEAALNNLSQTSEAIRLAHRSDSHPS